MLNRELRRLFKLMKHDAPTDTGGTPPAPSVPTAPADPPKTFTQEDLNRIAAQEKRAGVSSVYKDLGFETPEDAKAAVEAWKKAEANNKTEAQKQKEAAETAELKRKESEAKADMLEKQLLVLEAGVPVKKSAAVVALISSMVTDAVDFKAATEEAKKLFPEMFVSNGTSQGTGTGGTPPRPTGTAGSTTGIGARLAQKRVKPKATT